MRTILIVLIFSILSASTDIKIIDKPIIFNQERIDLTKEYIREHYGFSVDSIEITPKIIVIHWTADMSFERSFNRLNPPILFSDRRDIVNASRLNVSAHFMVDRDGTIYRLMPERYMARHVIGLNYYSIGIENVGGRGNRREDLTQAQFESNVALIKYLKRKYPSIEKIIGHYEYREMENTKYWLELDSSYRTSKRDPGKRFMRAIRGAI